VHSEGDEAGLFPVGNKLAEDMLARRSALPLKPDPVRLEGQRVRLLPLSLERDLATLHRMSDGSPIELGERRREAYDPETLIWRYLAQGPFSGPDDLARFLRPQIDATDGLCLCVFDVSGGCQVGVVNYMNNVPAHLKIELGNIWYSPIAQRSLANTEAAYLLLSHAFALGYRRVEWKCDALNARSRRAALRIGFRFEGIQEQHFIIKGRNRDTAWFRILDHEWPAIASRLRAQLEA
jgi:RimJ/RimL family protein N-acetyltransferase